MSDDILNAAFAALEIASTCEDKGDYVEAATKYYEGCYLLRGYIGRLPVTSPHEKTRSLIQSKVTHFETKATNLLNNDATRKAAFANPRSPISKNVFFGDESSVIPLGPPGNQSRQHLAWQPPQASSPRYTTSANHDAAMITRKAGLADARLSAALDLDEKGRKDEATREYIVAAELYLEAIKTAENGGSELEAVGKLLKRRLEGALNRVEALKNPPRKVIVKEHKLRQKATVPQSLSEEEVAVLMKSSLIASGLFLPWSDQDATDLCTQLSTLPPKVFKDPDGPLRLSDAQKRDFHKWARPSEILKLRGMTNQQCKPVMIKSITPHNIRQKCVTDCSMIASLIICAAFERRFQKRLITSIIYPQDADGMPVINPRGKYMVKLWLNGIARQVIVDDLLPIDVQGNLLCSHAESAGLELWVSIIEKAFMKLCGGYDFPGSNSGVDLFALTGWIPERIFFPKFPSKIKDHETPPERAFERLYSASSFGDCLITVSSSPDLTKEQCEKVGLVVAHAYAILQVVETRNGTRLLQLKNPWARKSWKGKYSSFDDTSWNDRKLCAEVGYNPAEARKKDDGIFWIGWDDVLLYFQTIQLSWNPSLFPNQATVHGLWPADQGPDIDTFNVCENPQYVLKFSGEAIAKKASVWVLLSRHVSKQEQEGSEVTDFLTTHIHRNYGQSDRIFYSGGKSCVLHGAYTNNPHVLMRYDLTENDDMNLSLVLSQYKKANDLAYTLSCFCTQPFVLKKAQKDLPIKLELRNEWTFTSAGGSPSCSHFGINPMYELCVPEGGASIQLRCATMKALSVNVMMVKVETLGQRVQRLGTKPLLDSGNYRFGFVATETKFVPAGAYTVIASTFEEGQRGKFVLHLFSSRSLSPKEISS